MKPTSLSRALWAAFGLLLLACDDRVAGGFDDVGNPGIRVSLSDGDGKPVEGATVKVYARYQNPFKDSLPILAVDASADSAWVRDTALAGAFRRAQTLGIPVPAQDTLEFNLIASSSAGEAYLGGFALVRELGNWGFIRRTGTRIDYADQHGMLASQARLGARVAGQRGEVGARGQELGLRRIFVPGSPYKAELEANGAFAFAPMAAGRYELKGASADGKIYTAADSLATGADYSASDWSEADVIWISP